MARKFSRRDVLKVGMVGSAAWALAPASAWGRSRVKDFREIWRILGEEFV